MHWEYLPIAIRFIRETSADELEDETHAVSGIHIVIKSEPYNAIIDDFIVTVNHIPHVNRYKILINHHINSVQDVVWHRGVIAKEYKTDVLQDFEYFKNNGFKVFPHDQLNKVYSNISILKINVVSRHDYFAEIVHSNLKKFILTDDINIGDSINIISSPFSFTNSLIFGNFYSSGIVNYVWGKYHNDQKEKLFYFTDIKYLENMNGGTCTTTTNNNNSPPGGSVGLVMGNLRKLNGDGDLTVIISWKLIFQIMHHFLPPKSNSLNKALTNGTTTLLHPGTDFKSDSVLPMVVSDSKGNGTWGTCVYYNDSTLVTNHHVIQAYIHGGRCQIHLPHGEGSNKVIELSENDIVITPNPEIDLSFIFLSPEHSRSLDRCSFIIPKFDCEVGEEIYTSSYGLFFSPKSLSPIESKGVINMVFKLPIGDYGMSGNCIIIASASSWNGSSGGGLFNKQGQFLGLICSNAQVKMPYLYKEGEKDGSVEKVARFSFILPVDIIEYCYANVMDSKLGDLDGGDDKTARVKINSKISDLWKLKAYHHDIINEPPKL
ncbi:uncharacterized protein J8A68_000800 [[Candida] subhashii]|uniref:Serine protease n=1 Tax=[Candida] subhashii TaxID=561895 RepID=A0A8J5QGZ6_9ASCO|nr:uncharacterized protein J8A68_000800 [[Candida] subhashii]KAG7665594.1 hypothetical protein J8A68_000800 [[Candida] subhashii]